jgi:hypothetical protein
LFGSGLYLQNNGIAFTAFQVDFSYLTRKSLIINVECDIRRLISGMLTENIAMKIAYKVDRFDYKFIVFN